MQRNMDLIRLILLEVEGQQEVDLSQFKNEEVFYHKYLLIDGRFAVGNVLWGQDNDGNAAISDAAISRLTWEGHDFLDAARNDSIWKSAMSKVKSIGGSVSVDIVKAILIALIKEKAGLS